jgi:sugar-phosphatase
MKKSAVIFDIDGLLINSEPLWNKAATEIYRQYGIQLNQQQYAITTGLRSKEFVAYWLHQFNVPQSQNEIVEKKIIELALSLIDKEATLMPGVENVFEFFLQKDFKMGLATSSPIELIEWVKDKLGISTTLALRKATPTSVYRLRRCHAYQSLGLYLF